MAFDLYCSPPPKKEIETQRARLLSQRKKASILSVLLFIIWAAGLWFLWSLNIADERMIAAFGGGMLALVILTRIVGGARAAVGAAACILVAMASTSAAVWGLTRENNLLIAVAGGIGGGFLLGIACLGIGNLLRVTQSGLRALKPVPEKKKAYVAILDLCKKHPLLDGYRRQVSEAGRSLLRGEVEAMKKWAAKPRRMEPVAEPAEAPPEVKIAESVAPPAKAPIVEAEYMAEEEAASASEEPKWGEPKREE